VCFIVITLKKVQIKSKPSSFNSTFISNPLVLFGFIFILSISFAVYNFDKGIHLKDLITQRENLLKKNKAKVVTIVLINPNEISQCYKFSDLSLIENEMVAWRRLRMEEYYKVKQIIVKE
jgi:hypothetical protein